MTRSLAILSIIILTACNQPAAQKTAKQSADALPVVETPLEDPCLTNCSPEPIGDEPEPVGDEFDGPCLTNCSVQPIPEQPITAAKEFNFATQTQPLKFGYGPSDIKCMLTQPTGDFDPSPLLFQMKLTIVIVEKDTVVDLSIANLCGVGENMVEYSLQREGSLSSIDWGPLPKDVSASAAQPYAFKQQKLSIGTYVFTVKSHDLSKSFALGNVTVKADKLITVKPGFSRQHYIPATNTNARYEIRESAK